MAVPVADRGYEVLAVYGLFVALTTLTMALRMYCRTLLSKHQTFGWDDVLALSSWALFMCFTSSSIVGVHHGTGQHAWNIHPQTEIPIGLKFWWLCEPFYVASNMAIKASIAVMLLRLAIDHTHRIIIWTTLATTELFSAGFLFFFIFQCWPSEFFWTRYAGATGGSCVSTAVTVILVYVYSGIICIGDWIFAILPCIIVWKLQMPRMQKLLVGLILAMGAIASAATIARIPYIENMRNTADFLYATTDVAIWSCSETGLAITASSCATLRPLFRSWFSTSTFAKSGASGGEGKQGYSRAASPGPNIVYTGHQSTRSVRVQGVQISHAEQTELKDIPKGRIRIEQCDSASVESATPSNSSTEQIVRRF